MAIFMIATIGKGKDVSSFRLLDCSTKETRDIGYKNVLDLLNNNTVKIENLKVSNGKVVGYNGAIERYTRVNEYNHPLTKMSAVVIAAANGRFLCANYKGRISLMTEEQLVNYANREGIANGKVVDGQIRAIEGTYKIQIDGMKEKVTNEPIKVESKPKDTLLDKCYKNGKWYLTKELVCFIFKKIENEYMKGATQRFGIGIDVEIDEQENTVSIKGFRPDCYFDMNSIKVVDSGNNTCMACAKGIAELKPMYSGQLAYEFEEKEDFKRAIILLHMALDSWGSVVGNCLYLDIPVIIYKDAIGENEVSVSKVDAEKVLSILKAKTGKMWDLFWKFYMIDYCNNGMEQELYNNTAIGAKDSAEALMLYTYVFMPNVVKAVRK